MRSMFRSTLVACAVAIAFAAVGVASASATAGPEWFVKGEALAAGKAKVVTSTGIEPFSIEGTSAGFSCSTESGTGEIIGGAPGTGTAKVTLAGCRLQGHYQCTLTSTPLEKNTVYGQVTFSADTVLVYPASGTTEALVALVPVGTKAGTDVFTSLLVSGTECGTLNNKTAVLSATGTEITEPAFDKDCGLLAQVGQVKAGAFAALGAEAQATEGALRFPLPMIKNASLRTKTTKPIECRSESGSLFGEATTITSLLKQELSPAELFGWKV